MRAKFHHSGALILGTTLVVSDLHLEKGTRRALSNRDGGFLPPYDTRETLGHLLSLTNSIAPQLLIFLGDTFDDVTALQRMSDQDRALLNEIVLGREVIWITGNHDPILSETLPGQSTTEYQTEHFVFRHEADPTHRGPRIEVSGHFHPSAKVKARGTIQRRPCFIEADNRIILPSMGAYTGGLNVNSEAFLPLNLGVFNVHLIGQDKVFRFPMTSIVT